MHAGLGPWEAEKLPSEAGVQSVAGPVALLGGEDAVVVGVGYAMGDQMVNDPRQFVRGRSGRLRSTLARPHAAEVLTQGRWAAVQRLGGPAQRLGGPTGAGTGV